MFMLFDAVRERPQSLRDERSRSLNGDRRARTGAQLQVALGLLGPLAIVGLLPAPQVLLGQLADPRIDVVLGAVALVAVTVVGWVLLAWALLVGIVAVTARLPGLPGVISHRLLTLITPSAARRILVVAAGFSLAVGATACGTAEATAPTVAGHTAMAMSISAQAPAFRLPPEGAAGSGSASGSASGSGFLSTDNTVFNLDWPVTASVDDDPSPMAATDHLPAATPSAPDKAASSAGAAGQAEAKHVAEKRIETEQPQPAPSDNRNKNGQHDLMVTVHAGDSLWSIAAAHLPDGASNSDIDHAWRVWYATNRNTIGANPNLVIPGQQLVAPTPVEAQQ